MASFNEITQLRPVNNITSETFSNSTEREWSIKIIPDTSLCVKTLPNLTSNTSQSLHLPQQASHAHDTVC